MKQHHSPLTLYRQELKKHSYFKQLFHTYALVSAALFLLFSALITYYVNDDYRHTLSDMQERSINRAYQLNQSVLQDIASSCFKIMEDADMSALLYSTDYTQTTGLQGRKIYDQMKQTSSLIHSLTSLTFELELYLMPITVAQLKRTTIRSFSPFCRNILRTSPSIMVCLDGCPAVLNLPLSAYFH